jgi:transmembrane sensor
MTDPLEQEQNEAAAWVARMDSDGWSPELEERLQRWLGEDPSRQGLLLRAQALWLALDSAAGDEIAYSPARIASIPRRVVLAGGFAAVAASVAGLFMFAGGRGGRIYTTGLGEIQQIPLADGSFATINTASKIEVNFGPDVRLVNLEEGEAWFNVAKNAARPFMVRAGDVWVRAVGTAFSVRRNSGGAEVIVTEGVIQTWLARDGSRKLLVGKGGRALVGSNGLVQLAPDPAKADRDLAWREGKIELVDETLANAIAEFNRYNQRKILLKDNAIATEQVDGVFSANDPESFALAVHSLLGVPVDMNDSRAIKIG